VLYVCDRQSDRVQIFKPDGTFIQEVFFAENTLASGSTWEIAFSRDPEQRFIYLTDGQNERVRIVKRDTMTELASFGRGGRQPGQFYGVQSIAVDSKATSTRPRPTRINAFRIRLQGRRQRAGRRARRGDRI
jgi:DNA-binding beta-propeller fold protein YncE